MTAPRFNDEWDNVIAEFGLDSEPMALPMGRAEVKKKLLLARGVQANPENGILNTENGIPDELGEYF